MTIPRALALVALVAAVAQAAPTEYNAYVEFGMPDHSKRQTPSNVPSYVTRYAPLVWLDATEIYMPSDLSAQLSNTIPEINYTAVSGVPDPLTLNNLGDLNNLGGSAIYLTGKDNAFTQSPPPAWLLGVTPDSTGKTDGATSCAIIVNDKGNGTVDAYYMYFYAYNQGNTVLGIQLGDHVGDWEHNMVRFVNGTPTAIWYSQHSFGEAFSYGAVEKSGVRPYSYSANGTHANYVTSGQHDHTIPGVDLPYGPLLDYTSQGTLWDPTLSAYYYSVSFNPESDPGASPTFTAYNGVSPTSWLYYVGQWGDQQLPTSNPKQIDVFGIEYKYSSGPTGPEDKQLNRWQVCPTGEDCVVQTWVHPGSR